MTDTRGPSRRHIVVGAAALGGTVAMPAYLRAQSSEVEISAQYQAPVFFRTLMDDVAREFQARNPRFRVVYRAPEPGYPELLQRNLRDAVTNTLPDVAFHGLNRQRALVDRGIPVDLKPFMDRDPQTKDQGYTPELLSVGVVDGRQAGIAFGMSRPVFYYNADLVKAAGGNPERLPATWDELIQLAAAIHDPARNRTGLFYRWNAAGDWGWQALVRSHGGAILDDAGRTVRFAEGGGREAVRLLQRLVEQARMPDISNEVMYQEMFSGRMGIIHTSSAELGRFRAEIKDRFPLVGGPFPMGAPGGRVPAGGQVAMMFAKDPVKQEATWEFIKFATGPIGATMMVKAVGYLPSTIIPAAREDMLAPVYRADPLLRHGVANPEQITGWFEFPGPNGLKITDAIVDGLLPVVRRTSTADAAVDALARTVQALLPRA